MSDKNEFENARKKMMIKIVARAWKDPEFKRKLLDNPKKALREMHFPIAEIEQVRVVEEGQIYPKDKKILTIVLPKNPADTHKLSEEELVLCKVSFYCLDCVKATGLNDRKSVNIDLIFTDLRSFNRGSFHASRNGKNLFYRVLANLAGGFDIATSLVMCE